MAVQAGKRGKELNTFPFGYRLPFYVSCLLFYLLNLPFSVYLPICLFLEKKNCMPVQGSTLTFSVRGVAPLIFKI